MITHPSSRWLRILIGSLFMGAGGAVLGRALAPGEWWAAPAFAIGIVCMSVAPSAALSRRVEALEQQLGDKLAGA